MDEISMEAQTKLLRNMAGDRAELTLGAFVVVCSVAQVAMKGHHRDHAEAVTLINEIGHLADRIEKLAEMMRGGEL